MSTPPRNPWSITTYTLPLVLFSQCLLCLPLDLFTDSPRLTNLSIYVIFVGTIPVSMWHYLLGDEREGGFVVSVAWAQAVRCVWKMMIPSTSSTTGITNTIPTIISITFYITFISGYMILLSIRVSGKEPTGLLGALLSIGREVGDKAGLVWRRRRRRGRGGGGSG